MLSLFLPALVFLVCLGDSIFKRPAAGETGSGVISGSGSNTESVSPPELSEATGLGSRRDYLLPLLWLALPLCLEILLSLLIQTVFGPKRYLLVYSPAYYMLLGLGIEGIRRRALKRALSVSFLALFSLSLFFYYALPTREDWRGAIRFMDREIRPGEVLYGNLSTQTLYRYYGENEDLIILDIQEAMGGIFAEGWMMLRERDAKINSRILWVMKRLYTLTEIEDFKFIRLFRFTLPD